MMHARWRGSETCSAAPTKVTVDCFFSWLRRWLGQKPLDWSERLAFIGPLLPHLCPTRLLSLSYLSSRGSGKSSSLAICVRRQVRQRQFAQGRDYFIQRYQFLPYLSTFSLQRLDNFGHFDAWHLICDLL
jgi:hypothetical protein